MASTVIQEPTATPEAGPGGAELVTVIQAGRRGGHDVGLRRALTLAWTLALTDWKLRFYGSALGAVWTLARPFAFFGVVYFVFTDIVGLDKSVKNYGVYILFGMVLFQFFAEITGNAVQSLVSRENLLRKMYFPPLVIPMAVGITALLNLGMTLVAVFIFVLANGIFPQWAWLELPVIIVLLTIFALGVGMLLSSLYVRYRDIQPIWEVTAQLLFYGSPVLYVATLVPESYQRVYLCNPLAALLTQVRHALVDPTAPSITRAMGADLRPLIPLGLIFGTFALGYWVFRRESPRIAENL
ncbi:MAG: ABC transporter permease [Actinomycetota bacterium]|nr:ABC transporter permease [Actinomycetota bacterium]